MSLYKEETKGFILPEWLMKLPMNEVKKCVHDGSLFAALEPHFADRYSLKSMQFREERHSLLEDYSLLVLVFKFKDLRSRRSDKKEVVLQYRFETGQGDGGVTQSWVYPNDPSIPHLSTFVSSPSFLKDVKWDEPCAPPLFLEGEVSAKKLLYHPHWRATFLLSLPKTEKKFILKMVQPRDFDNFLNKVKAIRSSPLSRHILLPKLVSYSRSAGIFLYDYIKGIRLKKLEKELFLKVKPFMFDETIQILSEIHQTALPALPVWDPFNNEINRLQTFLEPLSRHPCHVQRRGAEEIKPVAGQVIAFLKQKSRTYTHMIHNSFSISHLLYNSDSNSTQKLGVIDWDSACLGPKERDIGWFLAGFLKRFDDCRHFLDLYETRSGTTIGRNSTKHFFVYRHLLTLIHLGVKSSELGQGYLDKINRLSDQLRDNE